MTQQDKIIELKGLSKRYGFGDAEYYALRNFDLTVKRGEFIMIMGPSGCGKTTLLNIIGLLDKATSGKYILDDKDVSRISSRRQAKFRARRIGFIFQNFNLIPSLPVIENVALPLVYSGYHKTRRLKMASNILDHFHLQEREYYMPWQLSGGQQQRVAIARSLVASPSIILADEPTGNLDSRSSHIVMEELRDIHSGGNTIIMVTHNPALTTYATRVINMLDGEIDTDIKTVADHDLPKVGDPEKIAVRVLPRRFQAIKKPTIELPATPIITKPSTLELPQKPVEPTTPRPQIPINLPKDASATITSDIEVEKTKTTFTKTITIEPTEEANPAPEKPTTPVKKTITVKAEETEKPKKTTKKPVAKSSKTTKSATTKKSPSKTAKSAKTAKKTTKSKSTTSKRKAKK